MGGDHSKDVRVIGIMDDGIVVKCNKCGMLITIRVFGPCDPIVRTGGDPFATHSISYVGSQFSLELTEEPPIEVRDEWRLKVFEEYFNDKSK